MPVRITGSQGGVNSQETQAHVHPFKTFTGTHVGLATLTHPFIQTEPSTVFFTNSAFGISMNQNVTFSGSPELIFDGTDSGAWTSTAGLGTWNFADSGKVTITLALNLDSALWEDSETIDMSGRTAITGKVDLDAYIPANNSMNVQFGFDGGLLGNSVDLNDYIDTGDFTEQGFVIPTSDLGITFLIVDEMTITMIRSGGARPTVKFDDFQIEEIGEPALFSVNLNRADKFHIEELVFTYVDNITSLTTVNVDGSENATSPFLSYNKILGLSALTNGFVITRVKDGVTLFSATIRTLGAHISAGALPDTPLSDGTNTIVVLRAKFRRDLILTGRPDDTLTIQINDNMSDLLQFTASARGSLEVNGN